MNIKLENILKSYDDFQIHKQEEKINNEVNKKIEIIKADIFKELNLHFEAKLNDSMKKQRAKYINDSNNGVLSFIILMSIIFTYSTRYLSDIFDSYFKKFHINLIDYKEDYISIINMSKYNVYELSLLISTYHYCIFKIIQQRKIFTPVFVLWLLHVCTYHMKET